MPSRKYGRPFGSVSEMSRYLSRGLSDFDGSENSEWSRFKTRFRKLLDILRFEFSVDST